MQNRIRHLRATRGLSQAELAGRLAVSRQTVNALEGGKSDPSLPLAFAIAQLFGLPIEEVFYPGAMPALEPSRPLPSRSEFVD